MATVCETIPPALQPQVDAALTWFNERQSSPFEVTGILDPEMALAAGPSKELKLVLCGNDTCEQRSFQVRPAVSGFEVDFAKSAPDAITVAPDKEIQAELDPPPGARRGWLDATLARHAFVVLVFYRGFW